MGYDSCEPFGDSGWAIIDSIVQGKLMSLRILSELNTGRQRTKVEDDIAGSWYECWLLWDRVGMPFDKRSLGTPVLLELIY